MSARDCFEIAVRCKSLRRTRLPESVHDRRRYSHMTRVRPIADRVSKSQFKAKALEYFREAEVSGEPIIVTDIGVAKLEVRPFRPGDRRPLDALRGSVLAYAAPTEPVGDEDWDAVR